MRSPYASLHFLLDESGSGRSSRPVARRRTQTSWLATALSCVVLLPMAVRGDDVIEFLSGARVEGIVTHINKEEKRISFDTKIGGRTLSRVYPYNKIHAVVYNGQRYVLNPKTGGTMSNDGTAGAGNASTPNAPSSGRTRNDAEALIDQAGRMPPNWYENTPLDFPQTLDLTWPEPAPKGWNNQENIGQYIWDIINPNENRWRGGVRFMHHLLALHKDDSRLRTRVMQSLGSMYFRFFQDYARAAFWWRQARVGTSDPDSVALAECYWRLGSKQMAVELLNRLESTTHGGVLTDCVKVWGDMGNITKAKTIADRLIPAYQKQGVTAGHILLNLGDAYRIAGQYQSAIGHYQRVLQEADDLKGPVKRNKDRARANIEAIQSFELSDVSRVADGRYTSSSLGYEGQVHVEVEVRNQRITSVKVTNHKEKQFYSALNDVPNQIIEKQGVKGVDATSRATITAEAIINAAGKALASGAR